MNQGKSIYKTFVVRSMLVLYVFVSFFSVHFHHHSKSFQDDSSHSIVADSVEYSVDNNDTDSEHNEQNDCLSCHYFQHHSAVEQMNFSYAVWETMAFVQDEIAYFQRFGNLSLSTLLLRGPPRFV